MRFWFLNLFTLLLASCGNIRPADLGKPQLIMSDNWREDFYYATINARGSKLCDPQLRDRYNEMFEAQFGDRYEQLVAQYEVLNGPSGDFVVTSDCRQWTKSISKLDRQHQIARSLFADWLDAAEKAAGLQ